MAIACLTAWLVANAEEPAPPAEPGAEPGADPVGVPIPADPLPTDPLAVEPAPVEPPPPPAPDPELERLRAELGAEGEARDTADAIVRLAATLVDDRADPRDRVGAAEALGVLGDPRALPFLLTVTDTAGPALGRAVADAARRLDGPGTDEIVRRVARIRGLSRDEVDGLLVALGHRGTDTAAQALWSLAGDRALGERQRRRARDLLRDRYPAAAEALGEPPVVADALGGTLLVLAGGTAGGVVLSGVGILGDSEAGTVIGGIGGTVLGGLAGGLRLTNRPATAGEGLAVGTGVGWGVGLGALATSATYGRWNFQSPFGSSDAARRGGGGYRALSTLAGTSVGYGLSLGRPSFSSGVEVNLAGSVGTLFGTGITQLGQRPEGATRPATPGSRAADVAIVSTGTFTGTTFDGGGAFDLRRRQSAQVGRGALLGAVTGLTVGIGAARDWELSPGDVAFGGVVGAEAAWLGYTVPHLLQVPGGRVRGAFLAPGAGGTALGLVAAELVPTDVGRTASTAFGAGVGNALGASLPLLAGYDDDRALAAFMIPSGVVGTTAGWLVEPWLDPTPGDAAMIGVTTLVAGGTGMLVGRGLTAAGAWTDPSQGTGLGLLVGGVAGVGSWVLVPFVDARADRALFVGSGALLGGMYGALVPYAAGADSEASLFASAGSVAGFTALSAVAVSDRVGFDPGNAVVPELGAATGATLGALFATLATADGGGEPPPSTTGTFRTGSTSTFRPTTTGSSTGGSEDDARIVALGTVIGATVGLGAGVVVEVVAHPLGTVALPRLPRTGVVAMPTLHQEPGPAGTRTLYGFSLTNW